MVSSGRQEEGTRPLLRLRPPRDLCAMIPESGGDIARPTSLSPSGQPRCDPAGARPGPPCRTGARKADRAKGRREGRALRAQTPAPASVSLFPPQSSGSNWAVRSIPVPVSSIPGSRSGSGRENQAEAVGPPSTLRSLGFPTCELGPRPPILFPRGRQRALSKTPSCHPERPREAARSSSYLTGEETKRGPREVQELA